MYGLLVFVTAVDSMLDDWRRGAWSRCQDGSMTPGIFQHINHMDLGSAGALEDPKRDFVILFSS